MNAKTPTKPATSPYGETNRIERQVGREAAEKAKTKAGRGWSLLGRDLQEALVAREVLGVLLGQIQAGDELKVMQRIARVAYEEVEDSS